MDTVEQKAESRGVGIGMCIAAGIIADANSVLAEEILHAAGLTTEAEMRAAGVDDYDIDKLAYSGKVPVNVTGATPGQYLIPAEGPGGTITAVAVDAGDLTLAQSLTRLGQVRRVLDDGRPEIVVHVG